MQNLLSKDNVCLQNSFQLLSYSKSNPIRGLKTSGWLVERSTEPVEGKFADCLLAFEYILLRRSIIKKVRV